MNTLPAIALALLLAACGSSDETDAPAVQVTELGTGVYAVATGDAGNPVEGKYYAAADGSRLLVLNDTDQQASAIYRRAAGAGWQVSPATAGTAVDLLASNAVSSTVLDGASIAGRYAVRLATGAAATLSISANGDIVPGDTACKLSGKLAVTPLPNALKLELGTAGCGDLPALADGYLVVDRDYSPAVFRLVATGAKAPVDLWAYAR
ncbi:hypothetical protein [Massilia sp. METH4]|uniref:hypothetical protein n=1 Tax=Massilia sp. METH4 TaxID=3123041 RepID=UPI0030CCF31C